MISAFICFLMGFINLFFVIFGRYPYAFANLAAMLFCFCAGVWILLNTQKRKEK